ncbi:MAG: tetratricopeptide repeat protein [Caldimonas sp.]
MSENAALLQIDIVDSTKLSEALGDEAMSALWTEHDRMARDLMREWRGREIDKSDGFLLMFSNVNDAANYALCYHRQLATLRPALLARAGLHLGPVVLRETPRGDVALGAKPLEIDGTAKPLVSRVMALAAGGQTLITRAAKESIDAAGRDTPSHGHWRMKGIEEPVHIYELAEAGNALLPPVDCEKAYCVVQSGGLWVPRREVANNLPAPRDPFIGRRRVLRRLTAELGGTNRLTSIVGTAGVGKTRLAIQWGRSCIGDFAGGVWFCDLSQVRSLDGIHFAVSRALDVPLGREPAHQLRDAIVGRGRCLVILDNFEQVVSHAAATLGTWLDAAPLSTFLVTTREVLSLPGETVFHLDPMEIGEAIELFAERASAIEQSVLATADNRRTVEQLVRLLDGLPLAIELAAARTRVVSPKALLMRMGERFKLLSSRGGRVDRQATLKAAFDWSWDLLTAIERTTLAQASVFIGGFRLEAVEALVLLPGGGDFWLPDVIHSLVDKSLIRHVSEDRFDLLESLREYAGDQLRAYGSEAVVEAERRHGSYFASQSFENAGLGTLAEVGNVVASCRRAVARSDPETSAPAVINAWELLQMRGPYVLGLELVQAVLQMELPPLARAKLLTIQGRALLMCGQGSGAREALVSALAGAKNTGDSALIGRTLAAVGELDVFEARMDDAKINYTHALEISRAIGHVALECATLNGLGIVNNNLGLLSEARVNFEAVLTVARRTGQLRWESAAVGNLGQVLAHVGLADEALAMFSLAVDTALRAGDRLWEGNMLCNLGLLLHERSDEVGASANLERALVISRELGYPRLESVVLCNLGLVRESRCEFDLAQEAYEAALAIARRRDDRRCEGQFLGYLGLLHARCGRYGIARICLHDGEQILRDVRDRISLAIVLCARAEAELANGDSVLATRSLEEADDIAAAAGIEATSELGASIRKVKGLFAVGATAANL